MRDSCGPFITATRRTFPPGGDWQSTPSPSRAAGRGGSSTGTRAFLSPGGSCSSGEAQNPYDVAQEETYSPYCGSLPPPVLHCAPAGNDPERPGEDREDYFCRFLHLARVARGYPPEPGQQRHTECELDHTPSGKPSLTGLLRDDSHEGTRRDDDGPQELRTPELAARGKG